MPRAAVRAVLAALVAGQELLIQHFKLYTVHKCLHSLETIGNAFVKLLHHKANCVASFSN